LSTEQDETLEALLEGMTDKGDDREFLIAASDKQGHSEMAQFRISPTWLRQVAELVHSGVFPYKTPSDLYRHALVSHVQWLHGKRRCPDKVRGMLCQTLIMEEVLKDELIDRKFDAVLDGLSDDVRRLQESGSNLGAQQLVGTIWALLEASPDGTQKDAYKGKMRRQFGHLLPRGPVSLLDMGEEGEEEESAGEPEVNEESQGEK